MTQPTATLTIDADARPGWPEVVHRFATVLDRGARNDGDPLAGALTAGDTAAIVVPYAALVTAGLESAELVEALELRHRLTVTHVHDDHILARFTFTLGRRP